MSITTAERLELLSQAVTQLGMYHYSNVKFQVQKINDTVFNLIVSKFPDPKKYPLITIDLESKTFLQVESTEEMRKLVLIKLANQATSVTINKRTESVLNQTLFNIEVMLNSNYNYIANFINRLDNEHKREDDSRIITLKLQFQIVQPTYNEEGLGSSTYIEKINPILETLNIEFDPKIMLQSPLEELGLI